MSPRLDAIVSRIREHAGKRYSEFVAVDLDGVLVNQGSPELPLPGAERFLFDVGQDVPVVICTTACREYVERASFLKGLPVITNAEIDEWQDDSPFKAGECIALVDDSPPGSFGVESKLRALRCGKHIHARNASFDKLFFDVFCSG